MTTMTEPRRVLLVIEGPPPRKNNKTDVYANRSGVGKKKTAAYKEFRERLHAAWCVLRARGERPFGSLQLVRVTITAYWPRQLGDIDAPIETVLDSLTFAGVWHDDKQCDELGRIRRAKDPGRPRVEVEIETIEGRRE